MGKMNHMKLLQLSAAVMIAVFTAITPALAEDLPCPDGKSGLNNKGIPLQDVETDRLIKQHCTKCHSESRIINALQSMHGNRDENYEKEVKNIISRKIRLTNGDISRQDGKRIIEYLIAVWQKQKNGCNPTS